MRQPFGAIAAFFIAAAFLTSAAAGTNAADAQKIDACLKAAAESERSRSNVWPAPSIRTERPAPAREYQGEFHG
jgi:hypothetical protein